MRYTRESMKGGLLIKEARLRAGLTQAQLASRLNTTQSVVARWERLRTSPSFETVVRAIRACGLDLGVSISTYDDQDDLLIDDQLRLSPSQRVRVIENLLEQERILHRARRVG